MSRLIIHVGTHKTATTHIQDTFYKNSALLKRHGVIYPKIGRTRAQHGLVSAWIRLPPPYALKNPERAWAQLVKAYAKRGYTVFLSSEEFSRLSPAHVDMTSLAQFTRDFDDVRILCTLRNQASFLQSVYQQISDERQPTPWANLVRHASHKGMIDGLAIDYNILYDHLLTGFSADQIRFISFDAAIRRKDGIVGAFLEELEINISENQLEPFAPGRSNVSPPPLANLIANEMSHPKLAGPALVRLLSNCLSERLVQGTRTTAFSRREMNQLRKVFMPLNRQFKIRISPFQPGFELIETPEDRSRLFYREQLTDVFWLDVLRRLAQ